MVQEAKQTAEKDALEAREMRGREFIREQEALELAELEAECDAREAAIEELDQGKSDLINELKEKSRHQTKLNFSDFVAVMSGGESAVQKQLVRQVHIHLDALVL